MKKMMCVLAALMCWVLCVLPVKADVIWEPYNDNFYTSHREECTYLNRNFTADGPENKVLVYKSPENSAVVETWENGYVANIYYTWTDEEGTVWGMNNNWETDKLGWVPMEYMDVVYDYICFEEEFGDSFVEETVSIPGEYAKKSIFCFSYPGAETYLEILMPEYEADMPQCHRTYVDEVGRKWGYIGYFRGLRNKWVCLDNATADAATLYPEGVPERGAQMQEENTFAEGERISPPTGGGAIGLIICLVLGVCGATGGALAGMKKKKK